MSTRHLPVDCMSLTEIIRLNLETAGYYTGQVTGRFRYTHRGNFHCWDDPAYQFAKTHPQLLQKLQKVGEDSLFCDPGLLLYYLP